MAALDEQPASENTTVEVSFDGKDTAVVRVLGEIDVATIDTVRAAVAAATEHRPGVLVFDLSAVKFMDSSGIAVLLEAARKADAIRIRRPSDVVRRIITVTGLGEVLPIGD